MRATVLHGISTAPHLDITFVRHHDVYMRTTLTLEDDIARRLTDLAQESHRPFKAVVNDALRRGLGESTSQEPEFRLKPHAGHLRPGIDDRRFNELAWEMDRKPDSIMPSDRDL